MGTDITQGLPFDVQQAIDPLQNTAQPTSEADKHFTGPQGRLYDSGVARVPAPQVPMRPAGSGPEATGGFSNAPEDQAPDIHPVDRMANAFIDHWISQDKPAAPQEERAPGSFADKLAGAASALSGGLGDMRTGGDPGQGHGWLGAVGATLNARNERVTAEKQRKFENDERLKSDQINLARANMETVANARNMQFQDKAVRDAGAAASAKFIDTFRGDYKDKKGEGFKIQDNITQDKLNEMKKDPEFARTHTARITAYEPVLYSNGDPKLDTKTGLPVEMPLYSVLNVAPGDMSKSYTVSAQTAKEWKDAGVKDIPAGTHLPASVAVEMGAQAQKYGTSLSMLNLGKILPLPDDVKDQMVDALKSTEVAHAVASVPGNPLAGLLQAQPIVQQHIDAAQQQLAKAQQSGDPQAIDAAQKDLDHAKTTQQHLDTTINQGFTDAERKDYAKQKVAQEKEDEKEQHDLARDAETVTHNRNMEAIERAKLPNATPEEVEHAGQMVADSMEEQSQLSKRGKSYQPTLNAADDYSWKTYGKPFSPADASSEYKYATNSANQNVLKLIKGVTEPKSTALPSGGSLQIAQDAAASLPGLDSQTVNKVFSAGKEEFGNEKIRHFHTAMLGLADEYSKIMGGGVSSDTGRQQALDLLKVAYSKGQMAGAVATIKKDVAARMSGLIGNNRYLQRQYLGPHGVTTTMIDPKTGEKAEVPQRNVQEAMKRGAHVQTREEYRNSLTSAPQQ